MQKQGRRSRRIESGDQLLRDDAALAYAGDDHAPPPPPATHHQLHGLAEAGRHTILKTGRKSKQRLGFDAYQLGWSRCVHEFAITKQLIVTAAANSL
jgi:hypothetical protein